MAQVESELLTTRQVANIAKVSRQTVARWASEGKLPHIILPGGQLRFSKATIEQMLTPRLSDDSQPLPGQGVLL